MIKYILPILLIFFVCSSEASIQDYHLQVIAKKNSGGGCDTQNVIIDATDNDTETLNLYGGSNNTSLQTISGETGTFYSLTVNFSYMGTNPNLTLRIGTQNDMSDATGSYLLSYTFGDPGSTGDYEIVIPVEDRFVMDSGTTYYMKIRNAASLYADRIKIDAGDDNPGPNASYSGGQASLGGLDFNSNSNFDQRYDWVFKVKTCG